MATVLPFTLPRASIDATDGRETTLAARAQRGEVDAFEELYKAHAGRVYALCLRLTADSTQIAGLAEKSGGFEKDMRTLAQRLGVAIPPELQEER